jgi:adenosylcobyric acid synthase (glutamine-hydrolysing) (EC 6.3.5.10)
VPVIGICGGYQMLGRRIYDKGIESSDEAVYDGLNMLPVETSFSAYQKTTIRVTRQARPVGPILGAMGEVSGYEIHMGETISAGGTEAFEGDGSVSDDGLVFGTYLHGLFQNASAVSALLQYLYGKKGLIYTEEERTDPYDHLARHLEENLDMNTIVKLAAPVIPGEKRNNEQAD